MVPRALPPRRARSPGKDRDRDAVQPGEPVTGRHQDPERVLAEQQRRDLRRGQRGTADTDVQA
ncbi:MAG TPA: hypothetical protein VFB06_27955, partial [Streptosporangiaceae bacterium]|nr:hypothetical protein [Streptosporangiaceae bacterium]